MIFQNFQTFFFIIQGTFRTIFRVFFLFSKIDVCPDQCTTYQAKPTPSRNSMLVFGFGLQLGQGARAKNPPPGAKTAPPTAACRLLKRESDYCCRPHNTHNSRIRLDIGKGCLHMDRWMCQYSFRGLTVHTDISPSVIYYAVQQLLEDLV